MQEKLHFIFISFRINTKDDPTADVIQVYAFEYVALYISEIILQNK